MGPKLLKDIDGIKNIKEIQKEKKNIKKIQKEKEKGILDVQILDV